MPDPLTDGLPTWSAPTDPSGPTPRVALLAEATLVRHALSLLLRLSVGVEVVAEAAHPPQVDWAGTRPDVVVVAGRRLRVEEISSLVRALPTAPVVVLSGSDDPRDARLTLGAGASGYVSLWSEPDDLGRSIRAAAEGCPWLPPAVADRLAQERRAAAKAARPFRLSRRESEVLELLALGHTNREIACLLSVSPRTIEAHRSSIVQKVGLRRRSDLARCARTVGLVP